MNSVDHLPPQPILGAALIVRQVLADAFPGRMRHSLQCKRASMLMDVALKRLGVKHQLHSGWIGPREDGRGHVWVRVGPNLLDITLEQYSDYLGEVPSIVWGPWRPLQDCYQYHWDMAGPWRYHREDIRPDLVESVLERIDHWK
jgi:hypothetical protein